MKVPMGVFGMAAGRLLPQPTFCADDKRLQHARTSNSHDDAAHLSTAARAV